MNVISGDIIDLAERGEFDVIVQGCNCENIMGAGLAAQIKNDYPAAYEIDSRFASIPVEQKIGQVTGVVVESQQDPDIQFTIINGYTQRTARGYGAGECLIDYEAVRSVFKIIAENFKGQRIAIPKIGAGLGGGDWDYIQEIIEEEMGDEDLTLVLYSPTR